MAARRQERQRIGGEALLGDARRVRSPVKAIPPEFRLITIGGFSEFRIGAQKFASVIISVWKAKLFKLLQPSCPYMGLKFSSGHSK